MNEAFIRHVRDQKLKAQTLRLLFYQFQLGFKYIFLLNNKWIYFVVLEFEIFGEFYKFKLLKDTLCVDIDSKDFGIYTLHTNYMKLLNIKLLSGILD